MKVLFLLILLFVFFPRSLFNGISRERCNEAFYNLIQVLVLFCNDFLKLKHLILIITSFGRQLSKKFG